MEAIERDIELFSFNSSKVQLERLLGVNRRTIARLSIPVRYN